MIHSEERKIFERSEGLFLTSVEEADIERIRLWRNAQISVLRQKHQITKESQARYWESVESRSDLKLFSLVSDKDQSHIGYCGLTNIDRENRRAEISFLLDDQIEEGSARYCHYFEKALKMLCSMAFNYYQLNRVYTETYDFRQVHIGILESFGFIREGELREHIYESGEFHSSIFHGILKRDLD